MNSVKVIEGFRNGLVREMESDRRAYEASRASKARMVEAFNDMLRMLAAGPKEAVVVKRRPGRPKKADAQIARTIETSEVVKIRRKPGRKSNAEKAAILLAEKAEKAALRMRRKAEREAKKAAAKATKAAAKATKATKAAHQKGTKAAKAGRKPAREATKRESAKKAAADTKARRPRQARSDGRPPITEAIYRVMEGRTMTIDDILEGLKSRNWMPNSGNPRQYVAAMLSQKKDRFERVPKMRGTYRCKGVRAKVEAPKAEAKVEAKVEAPKTEAPQAVKAGMFDHLSTEEILSGAGIFDNTSFGG